MQKKNNGKNPYYLLTLMSSSVLRLRDMLKNSFCHWRAPSSFVMEYYLSRTTSVTITFIQDRVSPHITVPVHSFPYSALGRIALSIDPFHTHGNPRSLDLASCDKWLG
ncbi:hypothetical protein NPIL_528881 [Nephila pilipes]|uniref:Uncharacterized protein n=1 Tax=Nephila pilipes TaxID=299642 RepID=A0A8X6TXT7_NEPPI|nr:hypothetical protein NPIL_528881 [Nephila pilipes]